MSVHAVLLLTLDGYPASSLSERLSGTGLAVTESHSVQHTQQELLSRRYSVFVHRCDRINAMQFELLRFIKNNHIPTRVIINADYGSVDLAVRLMKAGASDFIVGEAADARLADAILQHRVKQTESLDEAPVRKEGPASNGAHPLVGQSQAIQDLRSTIKLVAKSRAPVLITGESGTGKEIVARQIHLSSDRAANPCVALNCAALPHNVIENELFGHERGAFSGAIPKKAGCFELAHRGTLFLDEIGEMDLDNQSKLLRVLEDKTFRRLGGKEEVTVDVKAIAATNKNLHEAIQCGLFREDLYYRLSVIELEIPPLREHPEDIPVLAAYFLSELCARYEKYPQRFSNDCMEMLAMYRWPGNVRELRNVVERSVVLCPHEEIDIRYLPDRVKPFRQSVSQNGQAMSQTANTHPGRPSIQIHLGSSTQDAERELILKTLASVDHNKSRAAKILGVSRKTLYNKINAFFPDGIEKAEHYAEMDAIHQQHMRQRPGAGQDKDKGYGATMNNAS